MLLRRRQLVLREAGRFPDLARKGQAARLVATQFAFLVVGEPLDTAMFRGAGLGRRPRELKALAEAGAGVFLPLMGGRAKLSGGVARDREPLALVPRCCDDVSSIVLQIERS